MGGSILCYKLGYRAGYHIYTMLGEDTPISTDNIVQQDYKNQDIREDDTESVKEGRPGWARVGYA